MLRKICLIIIIAFSFLYAQKNERVVAEAGNCRISESEFKERFNFSPHPKLLQKSDTLAAKKEFLNQLIAEKLLSICAQEKGMDTLSEFNNIITPLENMYIRDALYKTEIKDKSIYSPAEITEAIERKGKLLKVKFLFSKDREELDELYDLIKTGSSFDSLLSLRNEAKDQEIPRSITYGMMDKHIEDSLFKLKINEFTSPLESKDGYYILKLVGIENIPDTRDRLTIYDDIKKVVETRTEYEQYVKYYRNFFSKHKVTADKEIFEELIKHLVPAFNIKYPVSRAISDTTRFFLKGTEITSILRLLKPGMIDKDFIKLEDMEIKADYFINQLSHEGLYVKNTEEVNIRSSLSSYIRKFIEDELLVLEGKRKGLKNSYDVKKYVGMWRDAYLSKMMLLEIFDSLKVTDEEAYTFYRQNEGKDFPVEMVNIVEVLTDSLKIAEIVLNDLANGKSMKELASLYTTRDSLKERGGEFGLFPVSRHEQIGKIAVHMETGDIYGPLKLEEGYSIFQLIDKSVSNQKMGETTDSDTDLKIFNELKDQIIMQITLNRFENYVNEFNANLAQKYGVKIYNDVLSEIENTYLNLVVVRYMGFGGEIYAVPYTEQFPGWYEIWQQNKEMIQ